MSIVAKIVNWILRGLMSTGQSASSAVRRKRTWKPLCDHEKWSRALNYFNKNRGAFLAGKIKWETNKHGNMSSNMTIYCKDNRRYHKHYVFFEFEKFSIPRLVKTAPSSRAEYDKCGGSYATWCNQAASLWTIEFCRLDLDYHSGREHNANAIYDDIESGYHDEKNKRFMQYNKQSAINTARAGGLALAVMRGKPGHIAVVDRESLPNGIRFVQAGKNTGEGLTIAKAFGEKNQKKIQYYILETRQ